MADDKTEVDGFAQEAEALVNSAKVQRGIAVAVIAFRGSERVTVSSIGDGTVVVNRYNRADNP